MITVRIDGMDSVKRMLDGVEKQARFATAVALTRTAKQAQKMAYDEFKQQFDRPTPMVMKSLYIKPATKANLEAMVYMKNIGIGGKNARSMAEMLGHHFSGGSRTRKAIEGLLKANGFIQSGEFVAPGGAAKLDRYGNMSRGQLNQIISQLKIVRAGFDSATTSSRRSKRNVAKAGRIFWSYGTAGTKKPLVDKTTGIQYGYTGGSASHLPKGAWMSDGRSVHPLLIVIKSPGYRRSFDFEKIGKAAVDRYFNEEFDRAFKQALATSK